MNKNHEEKQPIHYVAIDISKDTLQIQDDKGPFTVANDPSGIGKLISHLKDCSDALTVFEATGGYERPLLETLRKAGLPIAMVNPARVRDFARSEGIRAKTDPIDARMILAFAKSKQLKPMVAPSASCIKLAALLDRRDHLTEQMAREKNRLQNSEAFIHRSIKRMIRILERELAAIEKEIQTLIDSDPGLKARAEIIETVKGVGPVTAWTLLAYLGEIEELSRNGVVAMAGVAPFNRDSGRFSGKRCIQGGRAKVRKCLYMAAHTAARCNPVIAPYVKRLRDRGKPYKCAIVAAMRKLLIHLQSLLKKPKIALA